MERSSPFGVRHIDGDTELELTEAYRKIISNESRLGLMEKLLDSGLCTRDIYSFACNQADTCETISDPDESTSKCAMKMKIRDLTQTLKNDHRRRRNIEMKLLEELGGRSWKLLKKIKRIKSSVHNEHKKMETKYEAKINHYRTKMDRLVANRAVGMDGMNKTPEGG